MDHVSLKDIDDNNESLTSRMEDGDFKGCAKDYLVFYDNFTQGNVEEATRLEEAR